MKPAIIGLLFGYVVSAPLAVWGMSEYRGRMLATFDNPKWAAEWQVWREETIRQSKEGGPVMRRPAKAEEPPMMILLRDYFVPVAGSMMLAFSIMYWFVGLLFCGSLQSMRPAESAVRDAVTPEGTS